MQKLFNETTFRNDWRVLSGIVAIIAAVASLIYYPSLHAPWYMDDHVAILENPRVLNMGYTLRDFVLSRGLALFSFSLNYRLGGEDPFGYHLVNLGLHVFCGVLVFLLLKPAVRGTVVLPLLGALLFVAHPLQTQAVTYVVQRMTVLSAGFFLLAMVLFVTARTRLINGATFFSPGHFAYYLAALAVGCCAMLTKENTIVLPIAMYLYVAFFLPSATHKKQLFCALIPLAIASLVFVGMRLFIPLASGESLSSLAGTTILLQPQPLSPFHYLVTEFSVLWVYLRMLFLPYGQTLHHHYLLVDNLFALSHWLAGGGLALLGGLAVRLRHKNPLFSAGVGWFFLTLAVESSFLPLDPFFEHRLYLPMFGFVLVGIGLLKKLPGRGANVVALALAVLLCLPLAWQRNRLWADPVAFFSDNLAKVPKSDRALVDLAYNFLHTNRFAEAEPLLLRALELNGKSLPAYINLVAVYNNWGRLQEAIFLGRRGLTEFPYSAKLLTHLGAAYYNNDDFTPALQIFDQALTVQPDYLPAQEYRARTKAALSP